jgi:hypothetical protein
MRRFGKRRGLFRAAIFIGVGIVVLLSRGDARFDLRRVWDSIVARAGGTSVERLFAAQKSNAEVELEGTVSRVLSDDVAGARHQRFIVELSSGHTVLVSHNIDLAARVPIQRGDSVRVRGVYEWNDRGGVVHWTHRDPQGRRRGGWIRHQGTEYR